MTVQTITLTYNSTTRTLTASPQSIGTTADVSSSRFAFTPSSGDVADIVFCASMSYLRTGRLDNPFVRIDSNGYAVIPGAIMSRLKDDDVDIYLKLTHADGTVETSDRLTMKVVTVGNTPAEADSTGALMIRGASWGWQSEQTYDIGAVASKGNYVYVSLVNGNLGHDPSEAGSAYWASVTGAQGPQGPQGPQGQTGSQGPPGPPLDIKHIYSSYQQMQADYDNPDYEFGDMVLISSNVQDPYNSQIYTHGTTAWVFFTDMSGAQGIQGPKGDTGDAGSPGTPFTISKTYASVSAMESDHASVSSGAFVVISSSTAENGYLFKRQDVASPTSPSTAHFLFVVSMAGPKGETGQTGPAGTGVPAGGQTDFILSKNSNADFDFRWVAQGSSPITSVNGKQGVVVLDTDDISEGSSNKYMTSARASKLDGIEAGAEVNVQSDWTESDPTSDAYIENKPTIPDQLSDLSDDATHRLVTDTEKSTWNAKQSALSFDSAPASGSSNPVTSGGIFTAIANAIASAVRPMGSCTAAELASKTGMQYGDMWNVTTDFIIGGVTYPAGTNVVWAVGDHWDPLAGSIDISALVPTSRKVNNKALTGDITLNADDLGDGSSKVMMTDAERTKLAGIAAGAEVNVQSDWNATSGDAAILNKPTIPSDTNDLTNGAGFVTSSYHDSTKENTLNADQKRKITISTADPTGGSDGDVWLKYTA